MANDPEKLKKIITLLLILFYIAGLLIIHTILEIPHQKDIHTRKTIVNKSFNIDLLENAGIPSELQETTSNGMKFYLGTGFDFLIEYRDTVRSFFPYFIYTVIFNLVILILQITGYISTSFITENTLDILSSIWDMIKHLFENKS